MRVANCIEWILSSVMVIGPLYVLYGRIKDRPAPDDGPKGIGVRVIQLIALFLVLPLIGILGLEGKLNPDTVGALLGVAIGYSLSGIEKPVPKRKNTN
jgi:hypothetical protein